MIAMPAENVRTIPRSTLAAPPSTVSERHLPVAAATLECLEGPAVLLAEDYRILAANRAYRAAFGNGRPVLGRRCFEVSHRHSVPCGDAGESCPLVRCRDTGEPCRAVHLHYTQSGEEHENVAVHPLPGGDGTGGLFLERIRPVKAASARPRKSRMVGRSPAFERMLELAGRVAPRMTAVLIQGETGTGKELLARAIHEMSPRSHQPFVPVDCSGISETLFESELFGHERGAFTGAAGRKIGLVESAAGGTLFLDEVGDIPLHQQVKLLRLLENGVFRRVGSVDLVEADFRLLCATHRDLDKMVGEGRFRADLYYRLSVFPIQVPPLRERASDVPLLAESLLQQVGCSRRKQLDRDTLEALSGYDFPGNVRELRNLVERACMMADGDRILPEHVPAQLGGEVPAAAAASPISPAGDVRPLEEIERYYLAWAVDRFGGDNRRLARRLGLSERTFYRKLGEMRKRIVGTCQGAGPPCP